MTLAAARAGLALARIERDRLGAGASNLEAKLVVVDQGITDVSVVSELTKVSAHQDIASGRLTGWEEACWKLAEAAECTWVWRAATRC